MKLGVYLPVMQSLQLNRAALQGFEQLGADDVWLMDHLMSLFHPALWSDLPASLAVADADAILDPFCVAAALGQTTDLRFGTAVTDGTRRRGADLARTSLTLQDACRGGFVLGIGSGEAESLLPFGYDYVRPVDRLEQTLKELRALFDRGTMPTGIGRTGLSRDGAKGVPQIWVAAQRPRMLELTGRYADGWLPLPSPPEEYAAQYGAVKKAAAAAGRDAPLASVNPAVIFGDSRDAVAAAIDAQPVIKLSACFLPASIWARYGVAHPGGPECRGQVDFIPHQHDADMLRALAPRIPIELVEELVWLGSADDIAGRLAPLAAAGAQHVVIGDLTGLLYAPARAGAVLATHIPRLKAKLGKL